MPDNYKTLKIKTPIHARLLTYTSKQQLKNGGKRITLCDIITTLLDIAETNDK